MAVIEARERRARTQDQRELRRTRGIIVRPDGDTLVVRATPAEVEAFGRHAGAEVDVELRGSGPLDRRASWHDLMGAGEGLLYDRHGNAVARVDSVRQYSEFSGLHRVEITAVGV